MLFPLLTDSKPRYTFKGATFQTINSTAPFGASLVFGIAIFGTLHVLILGSKNETKITINQEANVRGHLLKENAKTILMPREIIVRDRKVTN